MRLDDFTLAYLEASLATSLDEHGTPLNENFGISDIDHVTRSAMIRDAWQFQERFHDELRDYPTGQAGAGTDLWYTRNHWAVGYWQRIEISPVARSRLHDAAERLGEFRLYVGVDGRVYGF